MRRFLIALALSLAVSSPAAALTVVTDIPPVHALAASIAGDAATVRLLYDGAPGSGGLTAEQQARLDGADLVIWIGPELTPALADVLKTPGGPGSLPLLDLAVIPVRIEGWSATFADSLPRLTAETTLTGLLQADDDEHGHEHEHEHEHEHASDGHSHGAVNPYVWLDPVNAAWFVEVIRWQLTALDPGNAASYRENAEKTLAALSAVAEEIPATLAQANRVTMIPGAEGTLYFLLRFDMRIGVDGAVEDADDDLVLACQLIEPTSGTPAIDGATRIETDLFGASLQPGPQLYAALIRTLSAAIASCGDA